MSTRDIHIFSRYLTPTPKCRGASELLTGLPISSPVPLLFPFYTVHVTPLQLPPRSCYAYLLPLILLQPGPCHQVLCLGNSFKPRHISLHNMVLPIFRPQPQCHLLKQAFHDPAYKVYTSWFPISAPFYFLHNASSQFLIILFVYLQAFTPGTMFVFFTITYSVLNTVNT